MAATETVVLRRALEPVAWHRALDAMRSDVRAVAFLNDQPMAAFYIGMVDQAIDAARDAVFNVLNTAQAYTSCAESKRALNALNAAISNDV